MALFELSGTRLEAAVLGEPAEAPQRQTVLGAVRSQLVDVLRRPVFPVAWEREGETDVLTALDAAPPRFGRLARPQPLIAYNGALILDGDLQELYSVPLDDADFRQLEAELETLPRLSLNYYQGTHWYSPEPDNYWTAQEGDITGLRASAKPAALLTAVHKILVMGDAADILALENRLKPAYPQLEIHRSKNEYLEIVNRAATKAQAIQFMENRLGVSADEVIAFGDNYNDLDMLRYAGYSVAMGNAPDDIKAQVRHVTASNAEDGLAQALEELFP